MTGTAFPYLFTAHMRLRLKSILSKEKEKNKKVSLKSEMTKLKKKQKRPLKRYL